MCLFSSLETRVTSHWESDKRSRGNIPFAGSYEANPKQPLWKGLYLEAVA